MMRAWRWNMVGVVVLASLLSPWRTSAQTKPYSLQDIATLLESGLTPARISARVKEFCYAGDLTPSALTRLRGVGADSRLLDALRANRCPAPASAAPVPVRASPRALRLRPSPIGLTVGEAVLITPLVAGSDDVVTGSLTWLSTDTTVARVSNGTVRALAAGEAVVVVSGAGFEAATATVRVTPAQATSVSTPVSAANANAAATPGLDQLRLLSGRRITERTEVIQLSSVVFRDAETGLRYEFAKNDIDEIITEFGSAVRFRQRTGSTNRSANDRRAVSVGGRYAVTYEAARVSGSPACRDLWRGPSGADAATVRHRAGDDSLSIAFAGGDTFPSVLDGDGFFASTFRIMPGQEQIATALTTRLNGRFGEDGSLALQVTVIGYRRVQGTQGVACEISVQARGTRSP